MLLEHRVVDPHQGGPGVTVLSESPVGQGSTVQVQYVPLLKKILGHPGVVLPSKSGRMVPQRSGPSLLHHGLEALQQIGMGFLHGFAHRRLSWVGRTPMPLV